MKKLKIPEIFIEIEAFSIARIGNDQLYSLAEQELQGGEFSNIEILEMKLVPVKILDDSEVRYLCVIEDYRINEWERVA